MITDVVMFSGGVASWAAAKRLVAEKGTEGVVLLFADTKMEDEDLYRFIEEAALDVGAPLIKIAEGRTPWQVFNDERMMGNTRADPCSRILKREFLDKWIIANCDIANLTVHMGFTFEEIQRWERMKARWEKPWKASAPMCEDPWLTRGEINDLLVATGIRIPRLYEMGFAHNNCGGFCIKAGQGSFATLLQQMPERFDYHAAQEQAFRESVGKDVAILRDRSGGTTSPLPLMEFKRRRAASEPFPDWDMGGCNCMEDPEEDLGSPPARPSHPNKRRKTNDEPHEYSVAMLLAGQPGEAGGSVTLELIGQTNTLRDACEYIGQILEDGLHDDAAITEALAIFELCEGDEDVPDDLIAEAKAVLDSNLDDPVRVVRLLEKIVDLAGMG